jgi:hypothetical protein
VTRNGPVQTHAPVGAVIRRRGPLDPPPPPPEPEDPYDPLTAPLTPGSVWRSQGTSGHNHYDVGIERLTASGRVVMKRLKHRRGVMQGRLNVVAPDAFRRQYFPVKIVPLAEVPKHKLPPTEEELLARALRASGGRPTTANLPSGVVHVVVAAPTESPTPEKEATVATQTAAPAEAPPTAPTPPDPPTPEPAVVESSADLEAFTHPIRVSVEGPDAQIEPGEEPVRPAGMEKATDAVSRFWDAGATILAGLDLELQRAHIELLRQQVAVDELQQQRDTIEKALELVAGMGTSAPAPLPGAEAMVEVVRAVAAAAVVSVEAAAPAAPVAEADDEAVHAELEDEDEAEAPAHSVPVAERPTQREWVLNHLRTTRELSIRELVTEFARLYGVSNESATKSIASLLGAQANRPDPRWPAIRRSHKGVYTVAAA